MIDATVKVASCLDCARAMVCCSWPRWRELDHTDLVKHMARGVCTACYHTRRMRGTVEDLPASTRRSAVEVYERWQNLRRRGYTKREAASEVGMSYESFDRATVRHNKRVREGTAACRDH